MKSVELKIQMIGAHTFPEYAHPEDAGLDLYPLDSFDLSPGESKLISAGFALAIPETYKDFGLFGMLVPRSSSGKLKFKLANTIGIIDSTYRGEIKMFIKNDSFGDVINFRKDVAVCQLLLVPYLKATFVEVAKLPDSVRGEGGFGSTSN
jgi:dUTP pyrophosphatase